MKFAQNILAVAALLLPTLAFSDSPPPGAVQIRGISYAGTGCPAGSVAGNISPDLQAFTLLFDRFTAEAGPAIPLSAGRKNCQLAVDLNFPTGWQYSLFTVDTRGYLQLEASTTAFVQNMYYFQGQSSGPVIRRNFVGSQAGDYVARDTLGVSSVVWSPCSVNRALNISTSIGVNAPSGRRALATVDSIDGQFKLIYAVAWRRC